MDKSCAEHLRSNYGTRALALATMARAEPDLSYKVGDTTFFKRLSNKHALLEAEIVFACRQELACTAVDVLARRTRISFLDAQAAMEALPRVLELMAKELSWSKSRIKEEEKDAKEVHSKGPRAALPSPSSPSSAREPSGPAVCRRGGASRRSGQRCRAARRATRSMRPRMQPRDLVQAALDHPTRIHEQHHLPRDGIGSSLDPPPCVPPRMQGRTSSPDPMHAHRACSLSPGRAGLEQDEQVRLPCL